MSGLIAGVDIGGTTTQVVLCTSEIRIVARAEAATPAQVGGDGRLYGGLGGAAGEIGHLPGYGDLTCTCGGRGHLETLASGRAIAARYTERAGKVLSARDIAQRAVAGDRIAVAVLDDAAAALGRSILTAAGLLGIGIVIVGGRVARAWDLLAPVVEAMVRREPPVSGVPVQVLKARLDADVVAIGAAAHVAGRVQ